MQVSRRDLIKLLGLSAGATIIGLDLIPTGALGQTREFVCGYALLDPELALGDPVELSKGLIGRNMMRGMLQAGYKPTGAVEFLVSKPNPNGTASPFDPYTRVIGRCFGEGFDKDALLERVTRDVERDYLMDIPDLKEHAPGLAMSRVEKEWYKEFVKEGRNA